MKPIVTIILFNLLSFSNLFHAQTTDVKPEPDTVIVMEPETHAAFPGGKESLMKYMINNIRYPMKALERKEQGKVIVSFYVERTGEITNIHITKSVSRLLDQEALRVVKSFPNWEPARYHDTKVRAKASVPINFKLAEE